ncbi:MAG: rod shape-determining protein MreC [Terriglobales bacterium]
MENLISRYRNVTILAALLFGQVLGLAMQVKRSSENRPTRLIRIWAVGAVTPLERGIVGLQNGVSGLWRNYFYLRGVRQENRDLRQQIQQLEIERARLSEDAEQAHRLQLLLNFKEQFIAQTLAAQVIGSSGSEQSRSVYIDKGSRDGVKPDMAVMTSDGIVGKVLRVQDHVASVLLINDQTSGVGAMLEKSRLQGVLRGTPTGEVMLEKVMSDETVQPGEKILTSGGDQIFPKGLPVGMVSKASPGPDLFLNIRVKPLADLNRLEEVLVITQQEEREPAVADGEKMRAADILAERLPSVPDKPASDPTKPPSAANAAPRPPANANLNPGSGAPTTALTPKASTVPAPGSKPAVSPAANKPAGLTPGTKPPVSPAMKPPAQAATENGDKAKPAISQPQREPAQTPAEPAPVQDQPQ